MLVSLKEILDIAQERKIGLGAFNTPDMAYAKAIIGAAEELNLPVVIMHAQIHEEMGLCTLEEIAPMMLWYAEHAKVPVCVHLDHGEDVEYVKRALELGFTSVMYDGSVLSREENIANTRYVVELAKQHGASVEAEIGSMGAREGGGGGEDSAYVYTDPVEAAEYVNATGIDALACAIGTAHGLNAKNPKLDFERLEKIRDTVSVPLVMHGGSGVSDEDFRKVIKRGIAKVNYYAYMAKAGAEAINGKDYIQYHVAVQDAIAAMKENVKHAMSVFALR